MRIFVIATLLSMVPSFTCAQETPPTEKPTEQQQPQADAPSEMQPKEQPQPPSPDIDATPTEKTAVPTESTNEPISTPTVPENIPTVFTAPTLPEPVADEALEIPQVSPEEIKKESGIDTVSLQNPQGNWLFKRIWWERAEERYEKIRALVDAVWESRTTFFVKRNELDRNILDPFYLNIGIGQGELQEILSELVDFLNKKREQQGDLNEQERMLYEVIVTEEDALKQLQLDIQAVANLDRSIDEALGTLMNQINRVRQFEQQAWQNFREIARILDDTKARELYYIIEGTARNIKNISNYLEQSFLKHFNLLINETTKHIARIQNQIKSLKEKGVNFKRQSELLKQPEPTSPQEEEEPEEDIKPKPKQSWFGWITSGIQNILSMIVSVIRIPYDMLFGK